MDSERLAPPKVIALKEEAAAEAPGKGNGGGGRTSPRTHMERTMSEGMREEREDLKEAAEQCLNVIMDLGLDGVIRWVSPSWTEVVGTQPAEVEGRPIAELLLDNQTAFGEIVDSMKKDDSRSQIVRFTLRMGPASQFASTATPRADESRISTDLEETTTQEQESDSDPEKQEDVDVDTISLEGQGIMIYDKASGGESHTMWMVRPSVAPREVTIDLPPLLVESLGVGAEMLAHYLTTLAEEAANDPGNHAPPLPVLCRICERQIPPWWFEKHTELCLQEHKADMEVQMAQESLAEHRNAIVRVLDAFENRNSRSSGDLSSMAAPSPPLPEYKGVTIGPSSSSSSSNPSSGTISPATPPVRSRETSAHGLSQSRQRSFAVRRPLARIVELILDLCDTAMEISTPLVKDPSASLAELRAQSPQSESRISQVLQWQSPSSNTLDQEQGLALLCADTEHVARAKVDAVLRSRRILEYSERIRSEFMTIVQDCIDEALRKAAKIAAGEPTDSSSEDEQVEPAEESEQSAVAAHTEQTEQMQDDQPMFPGSFDGPSSLAQALRSVSDPALTAGDRRRSSTAVSTQSSSPKECPTPRSHRGALAINPSHRSKRSSMLLEGDAADSDSSMHSAGPSSLHRTYSTSSELSTSRKPTSRDRNRRSAILPGSASPRRNPSPGRSIPPSSPLTISKPALPISSESVASPITSPLLSAGEFSSPPVSAIPVPPLSHHHHHRRQSSATSSDVLRPAVSPRLTANSQARAVPPSIKDFEIIKPISKGAFGSVYLSKKKSTGDYFAVKALKKGDMVAKNQVTNVKAERAIMMWQGESDFVAKLYWTFSSKDYLYLVMEYLNGGDCASLIKVLGGIPEDWAKKYIAEVVLGVAHLHSRGIVHRDLKPDNLLIDQKGHLKLTDFGLSRMGLIGRQKRVLNSSQNEPAPDLLKQGPFARAASGTSSRSTSFDFHGSQSPSLTPHMTPDMMTAAGQPSYFNLSRESTLNRGGNHNRRRSYYRSDSWGSDSFHTMFSSFSLNDSQSFPNPPKRTPIEEEAKSEGSGSPDVYPLQPSTSQSSIGAQSGTPPQPGMMPPPMALFDPEDSNRRFVGTPDYLAPETINGIGQDEMSDWWSLGCILFEFLYGYPPFHASTPDKVFQNILERRIDWPSEEECPVSPEVKDIMNKLMSTNPQERLGANSTEKYSSGGEEVQSHEWFKGINWNTLLQDEAQFIPNPQSLEDTEYFDARGATLQSFAEEMEDQAASPSTTPGNDLHERPHDALNGMRAQAGSIKRGLMPLHIPAHVRDGRSRRLSEPVASDDFGSFAFKNLPVLEKANKDVIQKLRAEAMQAQSKHNPPPTSQSGGSPAPSLEGSPIIPMPLHRQLSHSKTRDRAASPSNFNQPNASPSRASQPSSPLLVSFTAGQHVQHHERRKTSSTSSSLSHQSSNSLQPASLFDAPRLMAGAKTTSTASSPVKHAKAPPPLQLSPQKLHAYRQSSAPTSRARSQTVGSQEADSPAKDIFHQKRRSGVFDMSPSSSDNEDSRANALLRVQRRRQSSRRMSSISVLDGPVFRPLDVLICEDHPVSRMVMEKLLEKLHCRTISVADGSEAMRFAMSEVKFDIILMEFKLPQINGADVARMIRDTKNANSQTPIVAVTGYLKELQAPHHFDAMIEKPPTTSKLVDVMSKLCQWKAPPPGTSRPCGPSQDQGPRSATESASNTLRQKPSAMEDSPSSTSSFAPIPGASTSARGSSREDSVSSSIFSEDLMTEEFPVMISRSGEEWDEVSTQEAAVTTDGRKLPGLATLTHQHSAPPVISQPSSQTQRPLQKQRSAEKVRAKRQGRSTEGSAGAESGDDEDEELGNVNVQRSKSPNEHRSSGSRGSKLGTEMLRTNSRGSVVSAVETPQMEQQPLQAPPLGLSTAEAPSATSPPEIFPPMPAGGPTVIKVHESSPTSPRLPEQAFAKMNLTDEPEVDVDATPRPAGQGPPLEQVEHEDELTPRPAPKG